MMIFDANLCFNNQVKKVFKSCCLQLKVIPKIKSFLLIARLQKVIRALFLFHELLRIKVPSVSRRAPPTFCSWHKLLVQN